MEFRSKTRFRTRTRLLTASALSLALVAAGCGKQLLIKSDPEDAEVFINDAPVGKTPVQVPFSQLPGTPSLKIDVKKADYGTYTGFIPGPSSANLSSEVTVAIPKSDDAADKFNRVMNVVFKAQQLAKNRRSEEALKVADDAIKDYPRFASLHLLRASILFLAKNYDGSLQAYRKVLELDGTNPEATQMIEYFKKRSLASVGASSGISPAASGNPPASDTGAPRAEPAAAPTDSPATTPASGAKP